MFISTIIVTEDIDGSPEFRRHTFDVWGAKNLIAFWLQDALACTEPPLVVRWLERSPLQMPVGHWAFRFRDPLRFRRGQEFVMCEPVSPVDALTLGLAEDSIVEAIINKAWPRSA